MATLEQLETSFDSSRPVELYEITLGTITFRLTSAAVPITIGVDTFEPEPGLSRSSIVQGSERKNRTLTVTMRADNEFARRYRDIPPGVRASVRAFRVQRDETPSLTTVLIFTGLVQNVKFVLGGTMAQVAVRTLEAALNQRIPRRTYMSSCNHFLYDQFCKVNPALHNIVGEVTAEDPDLATITVDGVGASSLKFISGFVRPVSEVDFRHVLAESGDLLSLDVPFPGSFLGQDVQVFAGCDHLLEGDCALVYDNVIEFGGYAHVPNRNPFQTGIRG